MQLKMLQFYRMLSNFATSVIGAFVPLLVYKFATQSGMSTEIGIILAMAQIIGTNLLILGLTYLLKKMLIKYPQLFLLLRIIPIIIYEGFILIISFNPILAVVGLCLADAFSRVFNNVPSETIYNYVSIDEKSQSLGITRFIEQVGWISAAVLGGLFLDNLNEMYLVIISLGLYIISVIPLIIFYIKNRKNPYFNKESVSTAIEQSYLNDKTNDKVIGIRKKFLKGYSLTYIFVCFIDMFYSLLSIWFFTSSASFFVSGLACGLFDAGYAIGCVIIGKLNEKYELKWAALCVGIVICLSYLAILLIDIVWLQILLFAINGLIYPIITIWLFQTQISKAHILGVGNRAMINYNSAPIIAGIIVSVFGLAGLIVPCFVAAAAGGVFGSCYMVKNENKTNKLLVDFLHNNQNTPKPANKQKAEV